MKNFIRILLGLVVLGTLAQVAQAQSCSYASRRTTLSRYHAPYYARPYYARPYYAVPFYGVPQPPSDLQLQMEFALAQQRLNLQQQAMQAEARKQYFEHVSRHNLAAKAKADAALAARIEKRRSEQAARIGQLTGLTNP